MAKRAKGLSQSAYAKHRNISQPRIAQLIREGRLKGAYIQRGGRFYIDPKKADAILDVTTKIENRPLSSKKIKGGSRKQPTSKQKHRVTADAGVNNVDFQTARVLNEQYKAALKKLEYEERQGKLIPTDQVEKEAFEAGRKIRDQLLSIPDRCATLVAAEVDPFECKQILVKEINHILLNLNNAIQVSKRAG